MTVQDPDRPPDPDGPHARWWENVYTLAWAAQRQDGQTIGLDQGLHAVLDRLIGRCAAQLHPVLASPPSEADAERIRRRMHHLVAISERVHGNTTVGEVRRLLEVYGPLARAQDDGDTTAADQRLDQLASGVV